MFKTTIFIAAISLITFSSAWCDEGGPLADAAFEVLNNRCFACHGQGASAIQFNIRDREALLQGSTQYVVPRDPEASVLWQRMGIERDMPPEEHRPVEGLPEEELSTIRKWIAAGAPEWKQPPQRDPISELTVLNEVYTYLDGLSDTETVRNTRIFSINHLYNNRRVSPFELQKYRAALSKAINSMSRGTRIVVPKAINEEATLFAVDLRSLGWTSLLWFEASTRNPYGLAPLNTDEKRVFTKIEDLFGSSFDGSAYMRADWFVTVATRPPLYHTLTGIPETLDELYDRFKIDPVENFRNGTAKRAGMSRSGVSSQNRLVEMHDQGAFWISYDFKEHAGRNSLMRFPLGPKFVGNGFESHAFEYDGGEVIFELRNGLHAYMLVDATGNRIDAGPVEIVFDKNRVSGSPLIVNGVSCMSCHRNGLLRLKDDIRDGSALRLIDKAQSKIEQLYVPRERMDEFINGANTKYKAALRQTMSPFLDEDRDVTSIEPVSFVATNYDRDVDLVTAVLELGLLTPPEELRSRFSTDPKLIKLGIGPLGEQGGVIKRGFWHSTADAGASVFQRVALELTRGSASN